MELPENRTPSRRPLRHPRARRAIARVIAAAAVVWFFVAPIVQAKQQDRTATAVICAVLACIVAVLFLPTAFLKWHARRQRR